MSSHAVPRGAEGELNGYHKQLALGELLHVDERSGPPLSVIVPTTPDAPTLPRCVAAIEAARAADDEVIVVEDHALVGPSAARNHGAATGTNPILVFIDADVEIDDEALDRIRARFAADAELVAVFGSYDDDPDARDVVSTFRNLLHHYVHQGAAGPVGSFWTGLGAVRRAAFDRVGGFDARMAAVEDIEFGARLRAAGRIQLDPEIQGKHLKRWTLVGMVRTDLTHRGIPWTRLAMRGRATRGELNLSWRHRVSAVSSLVIAISLMRRRPATATVWLGVFWKMNRRFYRLLGRRGKRYVLGGVGLHIIHHLTAILSVVLGVLDPDLLAIRRQKPRPSDTELIATVMVDGRFDDEGARAADGARVNEDIDVAEDDRSTPDERVAA